MKICRIKIRKILVVFGAALLLNGCLYDVREINQSDYKIPNSSNDVSYLLVDKGDYSANGMVLVHKIDEKNLDLVLDPSVYVVNSGKHTLTFSFRDFSKQVEDQEQKLIVTLQPKLYYQVIASRNKDQIQFDLLEITKDKLKTIGKT